MKKTLLSLALLLTLPPLAAPAVDVNDDKDMGYEEANDPLEGINRPIFRFNSVIDEYLLRPVASGYRYAVPQWGRQRVTNVFYNISEPVTVVNSILQADPENAFTSLWRFILNSTVGVLGVFDAASDLGLKPRPEDFGQTLGVWGYHNPSYLVLPILGPSSIRDGAGLGVDYLTNPFYNGLIIDDKTTKIAMAVANGIDKRANILNVTDDIEKSSLDPYITYRSYYLQNRENKINNGRTDIKAMTNY